MAIDLTRGKNLSDDHGYQSALTTPSEVKAKFGVKLFPNAPDSVRQSLMM